MTAFKRDYKAEHGKGKSGKTVWSFGFCYRHRRYRQSGFISKAEAEAAEAKQRHEVIFKGAGSRTRQFGNLSEIADEFINHRIALRAENTVKHEKPILKPVLQYFGNKRIDHIIKADIEDYIVSRRRDGLSNRTINIELSFIRCFLEFAMDRGYAEINAGRMVKNLKQFSKEIVIPTDDEFAKFLYQCQKTRYGQQFSTWVHLRYATGLRPSEAFGLMWSDIKFDIEKIRVVSRSNNPLKKGASRDVDMHPSLKLELENWRSAWEKRLGPNPPHNWVFFNPQNKTEKANDFRGAFRTARAKAGLPNLRSYDLRHYFISKAIMEGVDYLTIRKWTGHKSSDMIDKVYGHLLPGHSKAQMQKLNFGVKPVSDKKVEIESALLEKEVA